MKNWLKVLVFLLCGTLGVVAQTTSKKIDVKKSVVNWKGARIVGSPHHGTISFKEGTLEFKGNALVGGSFLVDMQSISVLDLKNKSKEILEKHLKNDDFFGVELHPISALNFTKVTPSGTGLYQVEADLTIKGISQPVSFTLTSEKNQLHTSLSFDRTLFGIRYSSGKFFKGLGNAAIKDNIDLEVLIVY